MKEVVARPGATLTLRDGEDATTVDLYAPAGLDLLAALWSKIAYPNRIMYEPTWLGVPIIQLAEDILVMQELIWKLRPDVIVECGVAHGGACILYASLCELMGHGRVIGVDVEIRKPNRAVLENHPMAERIALIEGSSVDPATVAQVAAACQGARTVLAVLDSNHSTDHVYQEIRAYGALVTPGSYLVVMDGVQAYYWDGPGGKPQWRNDSPLHAIRRFLKETTEFVVDPHYERLKITTSPEGFLRRLAPGEIA